MPLLAHSAGTSNGGSSAGSTSAGGSGPLRYIVLPILGNRRRYETNRSGPSVCGQSKVTTAYGGGFSASLSGDYQDAAGNVVALACIIDSPTAPTASASWSLTTAAKSQGNCQFNITKAPTATIALA